MSTTSTALPKRLPARCVSASVASQSAQKAANLVLLAADGWSASTFLAIWGAVVDAGQPERDRTIPRSRKLRQSAVRMGDAGSKGARQASQRMQTRRRVYSRLRCAEEQVELMCSSSPFGETSQNRLMPCSSHSRYFLETLSSTLLQPISGCLLQKSRHFSVSRSDFCLERRWHDESDVSVPSLYVRRRQRSIRGSRRDVECPDKSRQVQEEDWLCKVCTRTTSVVHAQLTKMNTPASSLTGGRNQRC